MIRWILLVGFLAVVVGCTPSAREEVSARSQKAFVEAKGAVTAAVDSAMKEASKLSARSDVVDLEKARDQADRALKAVEGIRLDFGPIKDKVQSLKLEIDRLDAAIEEKKLRDQWNNAMKVANNGKEVAQEQVDRLRTLLREKDSSFKALDEKLMAAERTYVNTCNRAKQALQPEAKP